jgi:hypothetical protein
MAVAMMCSSIRILLHSLFQEGTKILINKTSLSATWITRCPAWVHFGNINYRPTGIKYQLHYKARAKH